MASATMATASPGENGFESSLHRGEKAHLSQPVSKPVIRTVARRVKILEHVWSKKREGALNQRLEKISVA
jgi:hypothetical protein